MKTSLKRVLAICLVLFLAVPLTSGILTSAQVGNLIISPDTIEKSVRIQGDLSDLGIESVSIVVMDPSFSGTVADIWSDPDQIVALEQATLQNGYLDHTVTLADIQIEKAYRLFINGESLASSFQFANNTYTVNTGETVVVPITVAACNKLSGLSGKIEYDEELLTLESLTAKKGFMLTAEGKSFVAVTPGGVGLSGDIVVGYAVFTAKADLMDDAATLVSFPKESTITYNEALNRSSAYLPSFMIRIIGLPPLRGDVNLGSTVDVADAILLMQYLAGSRELSPRQLKAADVNADGKINVGDATIIMQMCL